MILKSYKRRINSNGFLYGFLGIIICGAFFSSFALAESIKPYRYIQEFEPVADYSMRPVLEELQHTASTVFVVRERGCGSCNAAFAKLASKFISQPNSLIVVQATGQAVDISPFLQQSDCGNIVLDRSEKKVLPELSDENPTGSYAVFYNEERLISEVIEISGANTLQADLEKIERLTMIN